jgi:signal transduction histidine kinase
MVFHAEPVDLGRITDEVNGPLKSLATQRRIKLAIEIDPSLAQVTVDPGRLKQVLYNYISNALKFTPEEGRVTVRIRAEGSESFRIEVEDTGIGIKPEDLDRLFVEFQQLDSTTSKKYQGTGLGLAFTKKIVEAQGGQVGVRSEPGQGSVFHAILPRIQVKASATRRLKREVS